MCIAHRIACVLHAAVALSDQGEAGTRRHGRPHAGKPALNGFGAPAHAARGRRKRQSAAPAGDIRRALFFCVWDVSCGRCGRRRCEWTPDLVRVAGVAVSVAPDLIRGLLACRLALRGCRPRKTYPRPPDPVRDCLHLPPQGQPDRPGLGGGADAWKVLRRAFPWERGSSAQGRDMRVTRACCRGGHDPDPVTP